MTEIVLVNTTDDAAAGTLEFFQPSGQSATVTAEGRTQSTFAYAVAPRGLYRVRLSESAAVPGWIRVISSSAVPRIRAFAILSMRDSGITTTTLTVPSQPQGTAFRLPIEISGRFSRNEPRSTDTGLVIINTGSQPASVEMALYTMTGIPLELVPGSPVLPLIRRLAVPARGQAVAWLDSTLGINFSSSFHGVLHLRTDSSTPIVVFALRARINERQNLIMTGVPPVAPVTESAGMVSPSSQSRVFAHIAAGAGYETQFVFLPSTVQSSFGAFRFFSQSNQPLAVRIR